MQNFNGRFRQAVNELKYAVQSEHFNGPRPLTQKPMRMHPRVLTRSGIT